MEGTENVLVTFVEGIVSDVVTAVPLTTIATVIGAIISGGIVYYFAMKYGKKGFRAIKNALLGKGFSW